MVTSRIWFTAAQKGELWERWKKRAKCCGHLATVLADARANSADRGQGAEEAEAPEPIKRTQELPQ